MNIGDNIKKFRTEKGMTQKELADKIDRSLRMVQKYESGEVEPSIEVLNEIATILDVEFLNFLSSEKFYVCLDENFNPKLEKKIRLDSKLINTIVLTKFQDRSLKLPPKCLHPNLNESDYLHLEKLLNYILDEHIYIMTEKNTALIKEKLNIE